MESQGLVQSSAGRADFDVYSPPGSTRKRHIRFAAHHDIVLLREVIHHNPFWVREFGQVWAAVAERMSSALQSEGFEVDGRRCRERTALLLDYYKRQNFTMLRRGGTEAMYMEKEDLLQKILELESEKREVGSDPRHRDPIRDTMSVTEETPRRAQEEASIPHVVESKQEDNNMGQRLVRNQECEGCCRVYARILQHLERRAESEQRLREEELALRREELQLQRERAALERERQEAERKERERRFELEREERQVILEILREKMIK
ncbi:trichohyalin-like isoform X2 [Hyla sarda]|uniref:trichohyalin-like isoform X2 n=1 Tax=Hyla sarda TaxID=327740 RepID=UPI0024C3D34D|nr:trichohyalin-like isoform X2 [Hyla sarda]